MAWHESGLHFAVATIVQTWKSAPREPGAAMAVAENGEVLGSVSGGCVEGAVYEVAHEVLTSGQPTQQTYGVSDDDAFDVGLTCGGTLSVIVVPGNAVHFPELPEVLDHISRNLPISVATVVHGPVPLGERLVVTPEEVRSTLGNTALDESVTKEVRGMLAQGRTGMIRIGRHGEQRMDEVEIFVQSFAPPPRMLVFGAIDFAGAVARIGKFLGYYVTVCDARPIFATRKRFPDADEIVVKWPHVFLGETETDDRTVICVLTHDPKFDVPVLQRALVMPARYIGAMGSVRTHEDRLRRLREAGVSEAAITRLSSPIGLDLGARTPEEAAISIAAEIIAINWGGSGQRLTGMKLTHLHR
jgi:xanthine dehydrogenase accessory factor